MQNFFKVSMLAILIVFGAASLQAQYWQEKSGTNHIYYDDGNVGIGTNNPLTQLSLGTNAATRKLALYDKNNDWYGLGILAGYMKLSVGNTNASYRFFAGNNEVFIVRGNGRVSLSGSDPDLDLDIPSSSSANFVQISFKEAGSTKSEIRYAKTTDELSMINQGNTVLTLDGSSTDYRLIVEKGIRTGRIKTEASLADYVFESDYRIMPLSEVEQFIWKNHHLPGVISAKQVEEAGGVDLTDFTVSLQEKLEELYLHVIDLNKRLVELETENSRLRSEVHGSR